MATKKCMQCGGTTKKMATGGSAKKECPPGYHMNGGICRPNALKPLGAKMGVGAVLAGGAAMIGSAIKNKMAARKAKKLETAKTASKTTDTSKLEKKAKGGMPTRTMGSSDIVGMPKYGNNPRTDQGRMLQKGGPVAFAPNRAVQASCKGGMVRDENGRCVMARKMAKGGPSSIPQPTGQSRGQATGQSKIRAMKSSGSKPMLKPIASAIAIANGPKPMPIKKAKKGGMVKGKKSC